MDTILESLSSCTSCGGQCGTPMSTMLSLDDGGSEQRRQEENATIEILQQCPEETKVDC